MDHVVNHFKSTDPIMYTLTQRFTIEPLVPSQDLFCDICETIIGQQLSVKAASTITARFKTLFPNQIITPEILLSLPDEQIRSVGSSFAKIKSMKDFATKVENGSLVLSTLSQLPDTEVQTQLLAVKGIGPWTVQMILMFSLGREDVFSPGDAGLKRAITTLYGYSQQKLTPEFLDTFSEQWKPYRTYASKLLWKSLDNTPKNL